uniref:Uncharacterized protein n=1 Tax=Arundo donax TaxID=35708 RepID=A0A0A9HCA5_ARUDO
MSLLILLISFEQFAISWNTNQEIRSIPPKRVTSQ